jgi:hypothetical protein
MTWPEVVGILVALIALLCALETRHPAMDAEEEKDFWRWLETEDPELFRRLQSGE